MSYRSVVLITGANSGLGFQIAKSLYASTKLHQIYLCGRSLQKAQDAVKQIIREVTESSNHGHLEALELDVTDDNTIEGAKREVEARSGHLDALVNNAGVWFDNHTADGSMTMRQVWAKTWDANVVGAHAVTQALAPLLIKSMEGRLLFTTSDTASFIESEEVDAGATQSFDQPAPAGWPKPPTTPFISYRCSKVGVNMLMREWRKTLLNDAVLVFCISPGFMATNLGGKGDELKASGGGDASASGQFVRSVIEGTRDNDAGKAIRVDSVQPW